jgi:hypothetical protein
MAVENRANDGPALVNYIRGVLRKRKSEGWNALREADRLQHSFEDMVAQVTRVGSGRPSVATSPGSSALG